MAKLLDLRLIRASALTAMVQANWTYLRTGKEEVISVESAIPLRATRYQPDGPVLSAMLNRIETLERRSPLVWKKTSEPCSISGGWRRMPGMELTIETTGRPVLIQFTVNGFQNAKNPTDRANLTLRRAAPNGKHHYLGAGGVHVPQQFLGMGCSKTVIDCPPKGKHHYFVEWEGECSTGEGVTAEPERGIVAVQLP